MAGRGAGPGVGAGLNPPSTAVFGRSHCPSPPPLEQRLGLSPRETGSPTQAGVSGGYGGGGGSGASGVDEIMKALNSDGLRCVVLDVMCGMAECVSATAATINS